MLLLLGTLSCLSIANIDPPLLDFEFLLARKFGNGLSGEELSLLS